MVAARAVNLLGSPPSQL